MTKLVLKISLLFVFLISLSLQATVSLETKSQDQALQRMKTQQISKSFEISPEFVRFPLYFIQNKGQVDEEALFFSKASKSTPSLKKEGLMSDDFKEKSPEGKSGKGTDEMLQFTAGGHVLGFQKGDVFIASGDHALRIEFLNARPVSPENEGTSPDTENNRQAAKPLARVYYRDLWEGVTLVYERNNDCVVKSTYTVQPGGTEGTSPVDRIRLRYNVPVKVDESGDLVISFETGEMKESRPRAWQEIEAEHIPVEVSFRSLGERKVGFKVGPYDPHFPLVIDPVLSWNTFMGSSSEDKGYAIAVDGSGNVYVAGYSTATWGTPVNAHSGSRDAFAAKLDSNGLLQWNTFMGASSRDEGLAIAVDGSGNVYVVGDSLETWGTPVNPHSGGYYNDDAFAAKLNSSGILQWHTFMGPSNDDHGYAIAVDGSGNVYVAGYSEATWGSPVNPHSGKFNYDVFATKLNSSGVRQWNTFMGSSSYDFGLAIAADGSGNVYLAGSSISTWGTPVNPHSGAYDAFAAKLNGSGELQWNTFMGSSNRDQGQSIALDGSGNVYVAGNSHATWGMPVNPYSGSSDVFASDVFAAKLNSSGVRQWHTFMGSANADFNEGITVDGSGNVYVAGNSHATWGTPFNPHTGSSDAFAAKLNSSGVRQWNTFMGSADDEDGKSIAVDGSGNVYVAGDSEASWGAPVNPHTGGYDAFAAKITQYTLTISAGTGGTTDPEPGTYAYDENAEVGVEAIPESGYEFSGWSGDASGTENPITITIDADKSITANFIRRYKLTITAGTGGTTNPSPGTYTYDVGTEVTITATPETGYRFTNWSGDVSGTDNSITITMDSDRSIQADFIRQYTLTIAAGSGGTTDPLPGSYTYDTGTSVSIKANPDDGYEFTGWSGDASGTSNTIIVTMDSDKSVTANFIKQYTLTISAATGGTTDPAPGSSSYDEGTGVSITAIPDSGYRFSGWTGDVPSGHENDNPLTITMDADKSITATFIRQYTLTIVAGTGGTTNPSPRSYDYDSGTQVSVTAIPSSGYQFSSWSGDASGTATTITINMDSDKTITASFSSTQTAASGDGDGGGGCFMATAAYGSSLHPHLDILRDFRDKFLMPNEVGRALVDLYYKYSPFVANLIAKNKALKVIVQINLLPFVVFSYSLLHFGSVITAIMLALIFMLPIFLISFFRRKLMRG